MTWGTGATYSTFTMSDEHARARAVAELRSLGYSCAVDEDDGVLLVDVDHYREENALVRCIVLRADPTALTMRK